MLGLIIGVAAAILLTSFGQGVAGSFSGAYSTVFRHADFRSAAVKIATTEYAAPVLSSLRCARGLRYC
jgi:hypothetical protein